MTPRGGGNPRLIMAPRARPVARRPPGGVPRCARDVTTIGSDPACDIVLPGPGAAARRGPARRADEFVAGPARPAGRDLRVNGAPVDRSLLRTASRVQLGDWTLSFYREEYADHGRPYGGRVGGEIGHQRAQPSRPTARTRDEWNQTQHEENQ